MARPVPADLEDALASRPDARDRFWAMPPEQKDKWVSYVERARFPGARRRRVAETVRRLVAPAGGARVVEQRTNGAAPALPRENWGAWLIVLAVLAAIAAFVVWLTVFRNDNTKPAAVVVTAKATVPGVTGIRYQSAEFQLKQAKLASTLMQRTSNKPKGIVLDQTPKAGKTVPQGTKVVLDVSKGPAGVAMPDVVGMAAADAVKALQARKLSPTLRQVPSQQPPGTVLAQQPAAGKRAKPGTPVVLEVAKGAASVSVPDVTGQPQQTAVSALKQAGLTANVVRVASSQQSGVVLAQNPAAGQKVAQGSSVRLNVSKGPPAATTQQATTQQATTQQQTTQQTTTTKPPASGNDYTGMRLRDAVQKIAQGRQQVIVQYVTSNDPAGVVVSNSRAGARERLQVSAGPHPKPTRPVPNVTGEDAAQAQQDLQAAGFSVLQVTWPVSDPSRDGLVVYETPAGGGQAPQGAAVVIYVGSASGG